MSTYAIGDVQGCHAELLQLLEHIRFDKTRDKLWFTGDLVNRGPNSLEVLRFVKGLGESAITVLGNHDLHLIAASVHAQIRPKDTFQDVLAARDAYPLLQWLRGRPLAHAEGKWLLVHAGVAAQWTVEETLACSKEIQEALQWPEIDVFLREKMYGDLPDRWSPSLKGFERLRFIINCFTRMRFCTAIGRTDFKHKGAPSQAPELVPWFGVPGRRTAETMTLFGHWSLLGRVWWPEHNVYGLDTGCVWGKSLTALRLDDRKLFSVPARQSYGAD